MFLYFLFNHAKECKSRRSHRGSISLSTWISFPNVHTSVEKITIHWIHFFSKRLLDMCHVTGTALGAGDTAILRHSRETDTDPCPWGVYILVGGDKQETTSRSTCFWVKFWLSTLRKYTTHPLPGTSNLSFLGGWQFLWLSWENLRGADVQGEH